LPKKKKVSVETFVASIELQSNQMWRDLREFYSLVGVFENLLKIKKTTLIIRGSLDHAQVGPLGNQPLMICFIGGFFFSARFGPGFVFLKGKQG
jgi:hypothetical protein